MKPRFSDIWRWDGTSDRGTYLFWGVLIFAMKYNLDRTLGWLWFDKRWTVFDWEHLRLYLWQTIPTQGDRPYYLVLFATSLPFLWAGVVLTLRRLRSLGWQPWWVLMFLVPVLKLIFFALLCVLPARAKAVTPDTQSIRWRDIFGDFIPRTYIGSAIAAVGVSGAGALGLTWLGAVVLGDYGGALFVGLPFCMGFLAALIHGYHERRSLWACVSVANGTVLLAGLGLLLLAIEGFFCILMAAPIAMALASLGGALGYGVQETICRHNDSPKLFCAAFLAVAVAMGLEHGAPPPIPLFEVRTSVVVNAPPQRVWRTVVSFPDLPPPTELMFKLGIAYPVSARIQGTGVGAIRYCNFSTGPFVEPIEVWDEPRVLKFKVTQNPEPMQEWTPYRYVHPPHLDAYLESRAGQFRLVSLDSGSTLLEGTTWYHHRMWPARYWQAWSDPLIHRIHRRVLNHVKSLSERNDP